MKDKSWFIGVLVEAGKLRTKTGELLLTKLPKDATESPDSAVMVVTEEDLGKTALVRGELVGKVLHSVELVETLPRTAGALIQKLEEKEMVSLEEIRECLNEFDEEVHERMRPKKLCALVIGHKKSSFGASNEETGLNEFDFNDDLAIRIEKKVQTTRIQRIYRRTYRALPDDINALDPDFVLSLHCNAYNGRASGTEVLYYHRSKLGESIANILQRHLVTFLGLRDRGIQPKTSEERGGYLLRYTKAPCVIAEPFFIDNDEDLAKARDDLEGLAGAYASAIDAMAQTV
ncbi:MAG: N-acetylmuramoyl-L-alanine amidase [Syntrophobacterales bacterium]|jgi:N-acetylmuramoyl-L-alanine amidase